MASTGTQPKHARPRVLSSTFLCITCAGERGPHGNSAKRSLPLITLALPPSCLLSLYPGRHQQMPKHRESDRSSMRSAVGSGGVPGKRTASNCAHWVPSSWCDAGAGAGALHSGNSGCAATPASASSRCSSAIATQFPTTAACAASLH
jgi:hypothetical protein